MRGRGRGTCSASGAGNINDATVDLPVAGSVTYTVTATISAAATGTLSNTATVAAPGGVTDPVPGNNSATDTDTLVGNADLVITKTDGVTTAAPGGSVTYTIVASNAGPSNAPGSTVADTFPASLTATWTCAGAGGGTCPASGAGNINNTVNLPAGGSVTYTVTATINAGATGTLSNTATVAAPGGVTDSNLANNSATDTDTLTPQANLSITKTDGVTTAVPGGSLTYTIVASNGGPSNAPGSTVADTFPASLTATWSCVGAGGGTCPASGAGNINNTVNLPAGGSVTFIANATISPSATGTLSNTATVSEPAGVTDPVPGNNSATDTDTLGAQADLSITKTDGVTTAAPGTNVTYTIVASNAGPSAATGSTVVDTFPASLTATWTCIGVVGGTCPASGAGNINSTVNLPTGGSVIFTVTAAISASATGTLSNTATVAGPAGVTDPVPANNSATDTDTLVLQADLSVTKTDGVTTAAPGTNVTYTIVATNNGPSSAPGSTVADTFPASLTATWTCVGVGGGTCPASGAGNINSTVNLPAGGSVIFTVTAAISASASGTLSNTATVAAPGGVTDSNLANNSATDTDTLTPQANLAITKTDGVLGAIPGSTVIYTIVASNAGPSNAPGSTVVDTFAPTLTATWTCAGAGGGTCPASGAGNINSTVNLPVGASVTYTVNAAINAAATGTLSNTATVDEAAGVSDPVPGNNSATDVDTLGPQADLTITKTDGVTTAAPGTNVTYTIVASNAGPSAAPGSTVADTFPASLTATWTCVGAGGGTCPASGAGNINGTVNLPPGGSVTYTVTAAINASATGTLSNTATVAAPGGVTDPTPGNNSATDTDTLTPRANLAIAKTDGVTTAAPGGNVTYTIVAFNAGPSNAPGSTVADTFPASLTATWTCVGAGGGTCPASGAGSFSNTVNLPVGGSVTYTVNATISVSATETLSNTATVAVPGGVTDPVPGNNSATDTDILVATADLAITKTDGSAGYTPGEVLTYTIVASSSGPTPVTGATVTDAIPAQLTDASWTCVASVGSACGAASGTGSITTTVNLVSGGNATFTLTATVPETTEVAISNTATIAPPGGTLDPNPANNSATDIDTRGGGAFYTVTPCRLIDTRTLTGHYGGPALGAGSTRTFTVAGQCGIPITASAVAANLVATQGAGTGRLVAHPGGTPVPFISSVNYGAGQTRGNNAILPLNAAGQLDLTVGGQLTGTVHAVLDVFGYFIE